MRALLRKHRHDLALVVGNGVNRYRSSSSTNSWNDLLMQLAKRHLPSRLRQIPSGIALTEFYDLLDLQAEWTGNGESLQAEFCRLMADWQAYPHHQRIVEWAHGHQNPILTTNFDSTLSDTSGYRLRRIRTKGFTDFYPWSSYFGDQDIDHPQDNFGIWHINGTARYFRSVRLGLTHYMGSVQRARTWFHRGKGGSLFSGKETDDWPGARTWLHIVFNTPLLLFGLALDENEVFLRWLLIERARYFRHFPERKKPGWYVHTAEIDGTGKQLFLDGVGLKPTRVDGFDDIYGPGTWA